MVTRGTQAGAFRVGDQFFEPGIGTLEVQNICGAVGEYSGLGIVLMTVKPVGKAKTVIENVWFNHSSILHKVI